MWLIAVSCVQVTRVEHRVLIKKNHSARLERELMQAQVATGRGQKRRADTSILQVSANSVCPVWVCVIQFFSVHQTVN